MLQDAQRTSAPSATSVSMRTAVWMVMCSEPVMRAPVSGLDSPYLSRSDIRPGISCSASSISLRPNVGQGKIGNLEVGRRRTECRGRRRRNGRGHVSYSIDQTRTRTPKGSGPVSDGVGPEHRMTAPTGPDQANQVSARGRERRSGASVRPWGRSSLVPGSSARRRSRPAARSRPRAGGWCRSQGSRPR